MRLLFGLVICCVFAAAQSPLERALSLTKEKRYAEADRTLVGVPEPADDRQRIAFHRLKAAIAAGTGKPVEAATQMRLALALAPGDANLLLATAVSESSAGLLEEALQHVRQAGDTPMAHAIAGDIEDKRGNYNAAVQAYQAAVAQAPGQESYRVALVFELIQQQMLAPAIEILKQSEPLFPQSAKIRTLMGIAQYANGSREDAVSSLEEAVAIDSNFNPAYGCLARILLESPGPPPPRAAALVCRRETIECNALRIRQLLGGDDSAGRRRSIAALESAGADDAIARCELGRAYEGWNQLQAARPHLEACARLDSTPQNHYRLALLYRKLGLADQARKEFAARVAIQEKMSQETAVGMNALELFHVSLK